LAARCSEAEERFALSGPLNRAPCAEISMTGIMSDIRDSATARINDLHASSVQTAEYQLKAYQYSVKPAQYGLMALGGAVAFMGAAWGIRGGGSQNNNDGGGSTARGRGGRRRRDEEGVTIEGEYTVVGAQPSI
jgi:hypothetical protein